MMVNGWHVQVSEGRLCCMACGLSADMDVARDCVCWPCRAQLGDDFLVDGVAYAVWQVAAGLLAHPRNRLHAAAVAQELLAVVEGGGTVSVADVVGMAERVVGC